MVNRTCALALVVTLTSACATTAPLRPSTSLVASTADAPTPMPPRRSGWKLGIGTTLLIVAAAGLAYETYAVIQDGKCSDTPPPGGVCQNVYDGDRVAPWLLLGSGLTTALGLFFVIASKPSREAN
jgi:hypothetical protein